MTVKSLALLSAAAGMASFIIGVIILADTRQLGFLGAVYGYPYGDKAGHILLYGLLSLFFNAAALHLLPNQEPKRLVWLTSLILALVIAGEELSQVWMPSRTPDWLDLLASFIGVALFAVLALAWSRRRQQEQPTPS